MSITPSQHTIYARFAARAASTPKRPFLNVLPDTAEAYAIAPGEISYEEAARAIRLLRETYQNAGYGAGARVGLMLENRPDFLFHWFALNGLCAAIVPLNADLRASELGYIIAHAELDAIVAIEARHGELKKALAEVNMGIALLAPGENPPPLAHTPIMREITASRDREAAVLYTSGTTGRPKGCVLSNEYFNCAGDWYAAIGGLCQLRDANERMLTPLPLFHMNALAYSVMAMIAAGGCLTLLDRFHPRTWWRAVGESQATIIHYLGVMPTILMAQPETPRDRDHSVRFGFGAGASKACHDAFERRFGFPLVEAWAMSETGAGAVIVANTEPRKIGTHCFGRPSPQIAVKIVTEAGSEAGVNEPGELWVRRAGPNRSYGFFSAYLKDPDETAAAWTNDWFHTGDIVAQDSDGDLHFVDRKKNIVRRAGENISAVEVESELLGHPDIVQVAITPAPDPVREEEVMALIVPRTWPSTPSEARALAGTIVDWCRLRIAYHKAPGWVAFVHALPMTSTEKILRASVKALGDKLLLDQQAIDTRHLKKRGG